MQISPEIPNSWAELKPFVLIDDNWIHQVQELAIGTKKVALIEYEAREYPEEMESYYANLGVSPKEMDEFQALQQHFDQLEQEDGTRLLFLPQFRRNAELLLQHFEEQLPPNSFGYSEVVRSLLLGYSELSYLGYQFYQDFLQKYLSELSEREFDEEGYGPDIRELEKTQKFQRAIAKAYPTWLEENLTQILGDLAKGKRWIFENGGL